MEVLEVLNDVYNFVKTNLKPYLTAIATKYGIVVDDWVEFSKFVSQGQQYPCVAIIPGETSEQQFPIPGNGSPGMVVVRRFQEINIAVWHKGNKTQTRSIEENVTAYMDALNNLFYEHADMDLPRKYQLVTIRGTSPTDLIPDIQGKTPNSLLKGSVFTIQLRPIY